MEGVNLIFEGYILSPDILPITPPSHCVVSSFVPVLILHHDILPSQRGKVMGPSGLGANLEKQRPKVNICALFDLP